MKLKEVFIFFTKLIIGSGAWVYPISIKLLTQSEFFSSVPKENATLACLPSLAWMYLYFSEIQPKLSDGGKKKAQHPAVTKNLLFKEPVGYPLGKVGNQYVCMDYNGPGNHNLLINGSSGSGKSSTAIISAILDSKREFLLGTDPKNLKESCHFLISDVKGEIAQYTRVSGRHGDGSIRFDPEHRGPDSWGFDPLWGLENATEQKVKERMETISISIVPVAKGDGAIWGDAARNALTGLLTWFYMNPRPDDNGNLPQLVTFPSLMRMIAAKPIKETVTEVVDECDKSSLVYMYLSSYPGMPSDTLGSVEFNLRNVFSHLSDKNLMYAMDGNPRKFSPEDLLQHSIYVTIPMERIESYGVMWNLISNLCLKYVMSLPEKAEEPNRPYFGFLFDEAGAIYSATKCSPDILISALKLIRSKGGCIICANQDVPSYGSVMDDKQLHAFLANFQFMVVLDAVDTQSQKEFVDLIPKFQKKKISYSGSGSKRKSSTSWQETPIYEKPDLASMGRKSEYLLISPSCVSDNPKVPNPGFATVTKCPYYKDAYFKKLYQSVRDKQKAPQ